MKVAIIFGPPGAGKGTQCSFLSKRLGFTHISTGAMIRQEIASQSDLGLKVKNIVESGRLVEDDVILSCLESVLKTVSLQQDSLILLDGIPRNVAQAEGLQDLLASFQLKINKVVLLQADLDRLVERFSRRWTCNACGQIASISQHADISEYVCPACHAKGSMTRRKDDELETVKQRFSVYQEETAPLISYYQDKDVFEVVDALHSPEFVYVKIASILLQS